MDAEERAKAVGVMRQALVQAGVSPEDAELAAPALVDEAARQQAGEAVAVPDSIGGQLDGPEPDAEPPAGAV